MSYDTLFDCLNVLSEPEGNSIVQAEACRNSYEEFVRVFWDEVPGTEPLQWNWHMSILCRELQEVAERVINNQPRLHNLIINISPGTSKSTLVSILFPAWLWARMPRCRVLSASHTDDLVLDLSGKSRDVIKSDLYRELFPEVVIRPDRDAQGRFSTVQGGDRYSCTVAGKSPTGRHAHVIICFPYDTLIETSEGPISIGRVVEERLDVQVLGYDHDNNELRWQDIDRYSTNQESWVNRVHFSDGSYLDLTPDHPVYVVGSGYVENDFLVGGEEVICVLPMQSVRQEVLPISSTLRKEQEWSRFLQCGMQQEVSYRSESSAIQQCGKELRDLRREDASREWEKENKSILQLNLPDKVLERNTRCSQGQTSSYRMRILRDRADQATSRGKVNEVLLSPMCQQRPFTENDGEGESELYTWAGLRAVSIRVCQIDEGHKKEREILLLSVRLDTEGEQKGSRCASHRLGQTEQCEGKSSGNLFDLSSESSGRSGQAFTTGKKIVTHVERKVWVSPKVYNVRTVQDHNYFAEGVLVHNCDDPIDPKKASSELELENAKSFFDSVITSRTVNKEVAVMILIMQRLHEEDPTGHLLNKAKREGADAVRHIKLPAELPVDSNGEYIDDAVKPPELRKHYLEYNEDAKMMPDGLMDPIRLTRRNLNARRTDGLFVFAGQYHQHPVPLGGGMFKETYFKLRARAAPYHADRVFYIDRASTENAGCYTAGVLMAKDKDGRLFVEWVMHGQWEPYERNQRILAAARRFRSRYGPRNEPTIHIEREGGASGKGDFQDIARLLMGFNVVEHNITGMGKKEFRAGPWSGQLAANNVWLVDNGESEGHGSADWDIENYIHEHVLFPKGKFKDSVDASSGALIVLSEERPAVGMRVLSTRGDRNKELRIYTTDRKELCETIIEEPSLLISLSDHYPLGNAELPPHAIQILVDSLVLQFSDIQPEDKQDSWGEIVHPYELEPEKLIMTRDHAKKLWAFLTKKRSVQATAIVIQDDLDRRAISMAMGIAEILGKKPENVVFSLARADIGVGKKAAPNAHVYQMTKTGRSLVV